MISDISILNILHRIPAIIIPFFCFFPLYIIGTIGAGDIKLFCLLGFYLPLQDVFRVLLISLIIAAILSIIKMNYQKIFVKRIRYFLSYLSTCISNQTIYPYYEESEEIKQTTIALTLPTLLGTVITIGGKLYESYNGCF